MPANSNPDFRGEYTRFFYSVSGEYDTTQTDAIILADTVWTQLCHVDYEETSSRELDPTEDACSEDLIGYTAGRIDRGFSLTMNEFRLLAATVRAFEALISSRNIIPILVLTADRDDPETRGGVMNCLVGSNDKTSPQKGLVTRALEFKPAARSAFGYKAVYGASVT